MIRNGGSVGLRTVDIGTMKKTKLKFLKPLSGVFLVLITVFIIYIYLNFERELRRLKEVQVVPSFDNYLKTRSGRTASQQQHRQQGFRGEKIVHLDLKGAPPKVEYLRKILPLFAKMGATGILMEYEDMFPYDGDISALNHYSVQNISEMNALADEHHLQIIPLVQTFGHMEFILKLEKYRDLREETWYPQTICPSNFQSLDLIHSMIDQVLRAHPKAKAIHIGCDEVFHVGSCNRCYDRMLKHGWSKVRLFLDHIVTVAKHIKQTYPGVKVLIWDDLLRNIEQPDLKESGIADYVTPVVWKYVPDIYTTLTHKVLYKYSNVFQSVWIASAFKGATGSNQYITDASYHVDNHASWMNVVRDYSMTIHFEGIFITGWQRYDHFAVLCELLPVAIPSLAMCFRQLAGNNDPPTDPPIDVGNLLNCDKPYGLLGPNYGNPKCSYPGAEILDEVYRLKQLKDKYAQLLADSRIKGWMNEFNVRHSFSNPELVESGTADLDWFKGQLWSVETNLWTSMADIYDNYTISEWMESYIRPFEAEIVSLWEKKEKLLNVDVWPRRPINFNITKP